MRYLVVHHSATPMHTTKWSKLDYFFRIIEKYKNGIPYHMVIEVDGTTKTAHRLYNHQGHATGAPLNALGVVICGNFEIEFPNKAQMNALTEVLVTWCIEYKINEISIYGHKDVPKGPNGKSTLCPGRNLMNLLPKIRADVRSELMGKWTIQPLSLTITTQ